MPDGRERGLLQRGESVLLLNARLGGLRLDPGGLQRREDLLAGQALGLGNLVNALLRQLSGLLPALFFPIGGCLHGRLLLVDDALLLRRQLLAGVVA